MDYLFLTFALILGLGGLGFAAYFLYRLMRTPEAGPKLKAFNRAFFGLVGLLIVTGLALAIFGQAKAGEWGQMQAAAGLAVGLWVLAAEGYGIGFQQMEQDGVGFLRFFQLGSSVVLCLSLAPAFFALVTYAARFG